jgi:aerobic carbon-monoxide dehydrogenase medium subunit
MITHNFEYTKPSTLPEALALLGGQDGAKALAGGMSLIPMMKLRLAAPGRLVDLSGLHELTSITLDGQRLRIGALATHYEIESSKLVRERCPLLAQAAARIGDVQVRNMGTIGGATAHNDPAADYPAALMALDAEVVLVSKGGTRTLQMSGFVVDALTTALEPGEIIQELRVPAELPGAGTAYVKVPHPASGYAVVGVAVRVGRQGGKVTSAHVGVTGLAAKAFRAFEVEKALLAGATAAEAAAHVTRGVEANTDNYASAEYRAHLAQVQTARAITAALGRSK